MAKNEHIVLPADPADPEDFDVTAEAMERAQRARLIRQAMAAGGKTMKTVTIGVESLAEELERFCLAFEGGPQGDARISFVTEELLLRVLTSRRWDLIRAMAGQGPLSVEVAARLVGHDVETTHGDIQALLNVGVLQKDGEQIVFPYDAVHLERPWR
jgi:predicted transcriptional regulator